MDPRLPSRIRLARAHEILRLRAIEDEAGTLFDGLGLIDEASSSSLSLPLKLSMNAFSTGFPGRMNWSCTPRW